MATMVSSDITEAKKEIAETVMGIYVIRKEGLDITESRVFCSAVLLRSSPDARRA
ncbi:hypothetical protein NQZ68_003517 [Dissostichus eleginoides]|nr:hypothetical protein NQZ68_003517 [Dissostichus eleginoides]